MPKPFILDTGGLYDPTPPAPTGAPEDPQSAENTKSPPVTSGGCCGADTRTRAEAEAADAACCSPDSSSTPQTDCCGPAEVSAARRGGCC
jgi:hypothetical protein